MYTVTCIVIKYSKCIVIILLIIITYLSYVRRFILFSHFLFQTTIIYIPLYTYLTASMAPRKHAASNVDETVTTKRSRKVKQPPPPEEPILDEGEQGKDGEGDEKGKGKRGGRGTKRGRAVGKGRGQGGGMYCFVNCSSSDDHFLQKNISSQGRGGSQSTGTC